MPDPVYTKLRVGIVGAGLMGHWHARTARRLGLNLVSIVDQNLHHAERLAGELGSNAKAFTTVNEMLGRTRPDIAHICTPLTSHYPIAKQIINAGVHVVVEKPVARSVTETQALLQLARQQEVKLCPVHQFGFQDGVINTLAKLDSLGELLNVRFTIGSAGGRNRDDNALNQIVADILPHPLAVLQRLRPGINLDTRHWQGLHLRAGELQLTGVADDLVIAIYISMNARPSRCEMDLFFSTGRIYLNFFHGYAISQNGHESRLQKALQPFRFSVKELVLAGSNLVKRGLRGERAYPGLSRLLACFYQAVAGGTEGPIPAEDILTIAAAHEDVSTRFLQEDAAGE